MGFGGVLRVKMWKLCVLTPKRHYFAWIRVCWCIACQNRFNGLSSRSVEKFCVQRKKKNWVVTLAIWGEVTPGAILTKCRVWGDMVDVITCAIFGDCRLMGVGVVRGVSLPSPIDLTRRPYNTGHTTVWPCDRLDPGLHRAQRLSTYIANRNGERTEPCLTPNSIWNSVEKEFPNLIHVQQPENKFSIISNIWTGTYFFTIKSIFNLHDWPL